MTFQLGLLGPVEVLVHGTALRGFESRKALALLCYLAVSGQPIPRVVLANLFWQDKSEPQGRANLSRVLNNLSSLLPGSLLTDRESVQLIREQFSIDILEFETLRARGDAASLAAAATLDRGEFMAGMYLDNCPEFEIWLVAERERWRQRVALTLELLADEYARYGDPKTALPFAARLLEMEPWHEQAHRQMMRLLAQMGQRGAALQQYETARRVLLQELGIEPGVETTALYEQIRAGEIDPQSTPKENLPATLTPFFGRQTELTRIAARLHNPECRLLTLVGAGGTGKTRLALQAARDSLSQFRDGVFFVPLAPIEAGQSEMIVLAMESALGFTLIGSLDPQVQLLNYLRDKQLLLLLDNLEHLLAGTALVIEILQRAPQVKFLVTSREALDVQPEWLMRVEGLSYPNTLQLTRRMVQDQTQELRHYSAVHLFLNRAQRVDENFQLNDETTPHVVRLCQIVEGMPLALELAAARIRTMGLGEIRAHLERNLDILATTMRDVETRHRSLRAVLDWSYATLSLPEQQLFQRLAVFAGGWTLEGAGAVAGERDKHTKRAESVGQVLGRLVSKSLVLIETAAGAARYRMLETIRQYALEQLAKSGAENEARARHAAYLLSVTHVENLPDTWFYPNPALLERLDVENDNVRAALAWSQSEQGDAELGLQLAASMLRFWFERGYWSEWRGWLEGALTHSSLLPPSTAMARVVFGLGTVLAFQGDYQASQRYLDHSRQLFDQLDNNTWRVYVAYRLGWSARERGDSITARCLMEESLLWYRLVGDEDRVTEVLVTLSEVLVMQEDADGAAALIEQGLALIRNKGAGSEALPWALNHAGHVAQLRGDYGRAGQLHAQSLSLFSVSGTQHPGIAWAYQGLGETALAQGNSLLAATHLRESLLVFQGLGDRMGIAWCIAGLAGVAAQDGDSARAARLWGAAQTLRQSIGARAAPAARATHERLLVETRKDLGVTEFEIGWNIGHTMPIAQAFAYALDFATERVRMNV